MPLEIQNTETRIHMRKRSPSYWAIVWKEFSKNQLARLGLWMVLITFGIAFFAPLLANSEPYYVKVGDQVYFPILRAVFPTQYWVKYPDLPPETIQNSDFIKREDVEIVWAPIPYSPSQYDLDSILSSPSWEHIMGTDEQGRDVASRMVYGARISLSVGIVAMGICLVIGIFMGACAGYFGGRTDILISRLIEIVICFPTFFLILAVLAFLGPSIYNIMIVIGITGWTGIARLVRGEFLKQRESEYVAAAKVQGAKWYRIVFRHIFPNTLAPVLVSATFGVASAILMESSLSFLGFGVQPPTPSWGDILSQSHDFIDIAWWLALFPGLAIFLTLTSYNLVGEGLQKAIDPRAKS